MEPALAFWERRRESYLIAVAASGLIAFVGLCAHGWPENGFAFLGAIIGGMAYLALANFCFGLGEFVEGFVHPGFIGGYRWLAFRAGLAVSAGPQLLLPLLSRLAGHVALW
jgi:hypothetical protein